MAERNPDISGAAIVLLGSFNSQIFQPQWFARQNLLPEREADAAEIKLVHPQIAHFETERFELQVTDGRFVALSKVNTNPVPLRDLVVGTFLILEHTPVTAMGINCLMHFALGSEERWHQLGDKLAPKEGWRGILEGRPGMLSLSIVTPWNESNRSQFRTKVEPSTRIQYGAYFETNEHFKAPETEPLKGLMKILNDRWEESLRYGSRVANHILDWASS